MATRFRFETPENVQVSYHLAGAGTRYVAWFLDNILVLFLGFLLIILLLIAASVTGTVFDELFPALPAQDDPEEVTQFMLYVMGAVFLIQTFSGLFYFTLFELLMRGQTPGKRLCQVRVVRSNGFSLDVGSIFVRNIFRVIDHLPVLWVVPVLSANCQRFGDMVAGTLVISERKTAISGLREQLAQRANAANRFHFDPGALKRLQPQDFSTLERLLERWPAVKPQQRQQLLERIVLPLAAKMRLDPPQQEVWLEFAEDLLAAEYRRQSRHLG